MRLLGVAFFLAMLSVGFSMFRGSPRAMATVDAESGDIMWIPVPNPARFGKERKCVFCRGYVRK